MPSTAMAALGGALGFARRGLPYPAPCAGRAPNGSRVADTPAARFRERFDSLLGTAEATREVLWARRSTRPASRTSRNVHSYYPRNMRTAPYDGAKVAEQAKQTQCRPFCTLAELEVTTMIRSFLTTRTSLVTGLMALAFAAAGTACGSKKTNQPLPSETTPTGGQANGDTPQTSGGANATGSGGSEVSGTGAGTTTASGSGGTSNAGTGGETAPSSGGGNPAGGNDAAGGTATTGGTGTQPATGGTQSSGDDDDDNDDDNEVVYVTGGAAGAGEPVVDPVATLKGDITFSQPNGTFVDTLSVELGTSVAGGEIHYTTDGTVPTVDSPVYSAAIQLTATTQIRAQAFVDGTAAGLPGTGVFVARAFDVDFDGPIMVLDTYGAGLPEDDEDRNWFDAALLVFEPTDGVASLSDTPTIASRSGVHLRGQSSAMFEKAPYRLEIRGNHDEDADYPLLGMPADADWVLRGPFPDKALIRDPFVYGLGRDMGLLAPRWAFVELYRNGDASPLGEDDYMGVYVVVETLKNSKNRIDLKQLESDKPDDLVEPNVTGAYVVKFEWMVEIDEEARVLCPGVDADSPKETCWRDLELVDPLPIAPEQLAWLTTYIETFNDLMHTQTFGDPTTGYASMMDVASFVDQFIIHELTRNMDAYIRSAYFHKDRDTLLKAGPLWDYDLSFGVGLSSTSMMGSSMANDAVDKWQFQIERMNMSNDWFPRLMSDQGFMDRVVGRWQELRQGLLSDAQIAARIDTLKAPLVNAAVRNFERWPNLSEARIQPPGFDTPATATWEEQIAFMLDWITRRAAWLDTQLVTGAAPPPPQPEGTGGMGPTGPGAGVIGG